MTQILIHSSEIQWLMDMLYICNTDLSNKIQDIVRNENEQLEIRIKPLVYRIEDDRDT